MNHKGWLWLIIMVMAGLAGCASAPTGPFQYTPDDKKMQGYQPLGKALRVNFNNLEITVEPLTMAGLSKVLNPGEKIKEVGVTDETLEKIQNTFIFYVTFNNQSKGQVLFNPTKSKLIYNRKNWYKMNTEETLSPLDYAEFYVRLNKIAAARERLDVISRNIFHGSVIISPGEKKSGLIFFSWAEKDQDVINLQLNLAGLFVGIEPLDFPFNFKVEPAAAAPLSPSPKP